MIGPWPAMAGHSRPRLAMAGHGWPRPAMAGHAWWPATAGHGRLRVGRVGPAFGLVDFAANPCLITCLRSDAAFRFVFVEDLASSGQFGSYRFCGSCRFNSCRFAARWNELDLFGRPLGKLIEPAKFNENRAGMGFGSEAET